MVGGTRFKASVKITNLGTEDNFKITAGDTHGFASSASPDTVTLKPNESKEVELAFDVPLTPPSDTNSLSVVAKSLTNDNVQNSALFSNIAMRAGNIVTVDAGNDIVIYERATVTLDGSRSSISGSGTLSYQWTMLGKAPDWIATPKLSDPNSPNPTFTAPEVGKDGASMVFQLTVTDSTGKQSSDVCDVRILNIDSGLDDGKEGGWCFIYAAGDAPDRKSFWLLLGVFAVAVFLARRSA